MNNSVNLFLRLIASNASSVVRFLKPLKRELVMETSVQKPRCILKELILNLSTQNTNIQDLMLYFSIMSQKVLRIEVEHLRGEDS